MLYLIRFTKYDKEKWRDEFIGYIFENPDIKYALCIKDIEILDTLGINKDVYKTNNWYIW